jgi:L-Ala-D/L-Glu epimerase
MNGIADATVIGVDVFVVRVPLFREFVVSFGSLPYDHVMVRLRTGGGVVGWGDSGHMLAAYSGETAATGFGIAQLLAESVLGQSAFNIGPIMDRMHAHVVGNPQAKCAFNLALYDLVGKHAGIPVHQVLGGAHVDLIPTQLDISIGPADQVIKDIRRALEFDVHSVGIKVGKPASASIDDDIAIIKAVRREFGDELEIWVDCNGGYTRNEAVQAIKRMEEFNIGLFEQPVPGWDIDGMAFIASQVDTPLTADESVWSARDVHTLARAQAADVIHMKLPKAAGITGSVAVARACENVGLPLTMASLSMTEVGQAALLHFVSAHPVCHHYKTKLRGGGLFFPDDPAANTLHFEGGSFSVPHDPGFGIEVDDVKIDRMSTQSWTKEI